MAHVRETTESQHDPLAADRQIDPQAVRHLMDLAETHFANPPEPDGWDEPAPPQNDGKANASQSHADDYDEIPF